MLSWISGFILKSIWGWKVEGTPQVEIPKKLYVVVPHTSNWDFPVGLLINYHYKMDVGYIAKHSLFEGPFGWFFKATGGTPVDRSIKSDLVGKMVQVYKTKDRFCTTIAPEGKRKKTDRLKKGFYFIAKGANIPIIYVQFDWEHKIVRFLEAKMPEENVDAELAYAHEVFKDVVGYVPEDSYGYPFENKIDA